MTPERRARLLLYIALEFFQDQCPDFSSYCDGVVDISNDAEWTETVNRAREITREYA